MKISEIQIISTPEFNQIQGICDGLLLYYKFPPTFEIELRADAFVAASLIPSMLKGTNIEIDSDVGVSPMLLENLEMIQTIFLLWSDYFNHSFKKIEIRGGAQTVPTGANSSTVSFFSGGVDGTYTFLKNRAEIDFLMFSKGIDMQLENYESFNKAFSLNSNFLKSFGKTLFPIETNVRFLGHKYGMSWITWFGGGLSSIALAGGFRKCLIASSLSFADMFPHGSSFVSDHYWSNEHTKIVHDGAECTRLGKIEILKSQPDSLKILRVCWHDKEYNCGNCEKCLRTMMSLRLLKITTPSFPECTDKVLKDNVSTLQLFEDHDAAYMQENLKLAVKNGDKALQKALNKVLRGFMIRKSLRTLDEFVFSGLVAKIKKRLRSLIGKN